MIAGPIDPYGAFLSRTSAATTSGAGLRLAVKDNLLTQGDGHPTTCASRLMADYRGPYEATAVARLRAAGAQVVGKTNLDEFAMGSSTEHSAFYPCKNPWDLSRVPGGSSGGSAAAVAAGLCDLALGSDTGGSIRQPAAFCGVSGLKPTYGRVSRHGLVAFASSFDTVGPLARRVRSLAEALDVIGGPDGRDATCLPARDGSWVEACEASPGGLRPGQLDVHGHAPLDAELAACVARATSLLAELCGATPSPVKLPALRFALPTYYLLAMAEASSNLARFDGVRYGRRAPANELDELYGESRARGLGEEVKRRILLGTLALSAGYRDRRYARAQALRWRIAEQLAGAFESCDVIVLPTTPTAAFRLGSRLDDPQAMYSADVYTVAASLAGVPALSLPCGFVQGEGGHELPVGLQLMAPAGREDVLFRLGAAYQRETDWHLRQPPAPEELEV